MSGFLTTFVMKQPIVILNEVKDLSFFWQYEILRRAQNDRSGTVKLFQQTNRSGSGAIYSAVILLDSGSPYHYSMVITRYIKKRRIS